MRERDPSAEHTVSAVQWKWFMAAMGRRWRGNNVRLGPERGALASGAGLAGGSVMMLEHKEKTVSINSQTRKYQCLQMGSWSPRSRQQSIWTPLPTLAVFTTSEVDISWKLRVHEFRNCGGHGNTRNSRRQAGAGSRLREGFFTKLKTSRPF